jgi:predicted nucleic acid-binding protein
MFSLTLHYFTLVSLTANEMIEMMQTVRAAAERGLPGPLIYGALILACARKVRARSIYTHNVQDFKRIAPDQAARIPEP